MCTNPYFTFLYNKLLLLCVQVLIHDLLTDTLFIKMLTYCFFEKNILRCFFAFWLHYKMNESYFVRIPLIVSKVSRFMNDFLNLLFIFVSSLLRSELIVFSVYCRFFKLFYLITSLFHTHQLWSLNNNIFNFLINLSYLVLSFITITFTAHLSFVFLNWLNELL